MKTSSQRPSILGDKVELRRSKQENIAIEYKEARGQKEG
jgi:hypothetical protein